MLYKKQLRDILIILGISLLILVVLEVGLRLMYPDTVHQTFQPYGSNVSYLRALKPNIWTTFRRSQANGEDTIRWKTNAHGFRGEELLAAPDMRIMVYGDSNIQARFSHLQHTFPYKLQEYLRALTGKHIEVVNAGIIGFGPDQSLIRFSLEIEQFKPDIAIFHVFADNDFGDLIRNQLFTTNSQIDALNINSIPENSNMSFWSLNELREKLSSLSLTKEVLSIWRYIQSLVGQDYTKRSQYKNEPAMEEQFEKITSASVRDWKRYKEGKRTSGDHYDIDLALFPEKESAKTKRVLMSHVLKKAKKLAGSKGIKFMVVIQPSSRDVTTNLALNFKHFLQYPQYKRNNLTSAVDNICLDNKIHKVNLFDVFLESSPETLYFAAGNNHWNDSGQDIAAQEVAQYIYGEWLD